MEKRLYKVTIEGNVDSLLELIQDDPLILDRSIATSFGETPLHISALLGYEPVCVELLRRKPELARELDSCGSTSLHLAAAKGHLGIVKALVSVNQDSCFVRDKNGNNPFHVAAMKGRIGVLKELLATKSDAARALASRGRTILYLCVEYCQLETLKFLVENLDLKELVNLKDCSGNTILHLAVADKQIETIDYLLGSTRIEVNSINNYGLTALDILAQTRLNTQELHILESLQSSGAIKANSLDQSHSTISSSFGNQKSWDQYDERLDKKRDVLMVVASLIASMGFAAGVSPPSGLSDIDQSHEALATYSRFLIYNTTGFISSLTIILLILTGVPLRSPVMVRTLIVIMGIAVTSTALAYTAAVELNSSPRKFLAVKVVLIFHDGVWLCVMGALLFRMVRFVMIRTSNSFLRISSVFNSWLIEENESSV